MAITLSPEATEVLHEVRPSPTIDDLKGSLQPALEKIQAEIDALSVKLLRYAAAMRELEDAANQG